MIHFSILNGNQGGLSFFICRCIALVILIYLNATVLAFLRKHRMAPSNTMILIRCHIVCSLLIIVDVAFFPFIEDKPMHDLRYAVLICYFINNRFSYSFFSICCVEIMILLSIDRFICIVLPFKYILLRRRHYYMALVPAFVAGVINMIMFLTMNCVQHNNMENTTTYTCGMKQMDTRLFFFLTLFIICNILILIILNIVASVHLWRSLKTDQI